MAKKKEKFYAVKLGHDTGIFNTWPECQKAISGFPGAEYKSFITIEEAQAYIDGKDIWLEEIQKYTKNGIPVAFTDGSFNKNTEEYGYGVYILHPDGSDYELYNKSKNEKYIKDANITGEILGVINAIEWALSHGFSKMTIFHDLKHIPYWVSGEYKANSEIAKAFKFKWDNKYKEIIDVNYVKVKGHSNNPYNDKADKLAELAVKEGKKSLKIGPNYYTIKNHSNDIFEYINEIKELNTKLDIHEIDNKGFKSIKMFLDKDSVSINIYKNHTVYVQGKSSDLFQLLLSYIIEGLKKESDVFNVLGKNNIKKSIESDFIKYLPSLNNVSGLNLRLVNLIKGALIDLRNKAYDDLEFSKYTFNGLRALEGMLKVLFGKLSININQKDGFNMFVPYKDGSGLYHLPKGYIKNHCPSISASQKVSLEDMYNFLRRNRYSLFHFGDVVGETDNTRVLNTKNEANIIIKDTLKIINDCYF